MLVVEVVGGVPLNLTDGLDLSASGIRWSADGRHVYFSVANGLSTHVYSVPVSGGEPRMVLPDDEYMYSLTQISDDDKASIGQFVKDMQFLRKEAGR